MSEKEDYEEKSSFNCDDVRDKFKLAKVIVAFANTYGGIVRLSNITGHRGFLDTARLHDFISKHFHPTVSFIETVDHFDYAVISVPQSLFAPHIAIGTRTVKIDDKDVTILQEGQFFVRRSSKTTIATKEDYDRVIRDGVSQWLKQLGQSIAERGVSFTGGTTGFPIRFAEGGPALTVSLGSSHPFCAGDIGVQLGRTASYVGRIINVLNIRNNPEYCHRIPGGKQPIYRFSQKTADAVKHWIEQNPDSSPYSIDITSNQ